jgi:hypothetical protein
MTLDSEYVFSDASAGDIIRVDEVRRALVLLLDDANYHAFRLGRTFVGMGGWYRRAPVYFEVPRPGDWHVVINAGGLLAGNASASIASAHAPQAS